MINLFSELNSYAMILLHFFVILGLICSSSALKILGLFPHPGISHFNFFQPIMKGLASDGHDVTVISHFPEKTPTKNYNDMPLDEVSTLSDAVDLNVSYFNFYS